MFVVWAYLYETYWDVFGYQVTVRIVLRHCAPRVISPVVIWHRKERPEQCASTYG